MKKLLLSIVFFLSLIFSGFSAVYYVDLSATGTNDGSSWLDAFTTIESAIDAATIGDEIWVAQGSYTPETTSSTDYYSLKNGVEMYGGFSGTEMLLEERNVELYTTTLDGNINDPGSSTDNLLHVVKALDVTLSTRLDGFTIINGRADGTFLTSEMGGGFMNEGGSCSIANCTFLGNYCSYGGGAIAQYSNGILNMDNCIIRSNLSDSKGGGIIVRIGTLNITNSDISSNECAGSGGAIRVYEGTINLDRCSISGNIAGNSSTINVDDEGAINCTNSVIVGNVANSSSVANISLLSNNESHSFINCTIAHNRNNDSENVANSRSMFLNDNTEIRNCIVWDNNGVGTGEINSGGTTISHSIVSGGYTISGEQQPNIYQNDPEFVSPTNSAAAPFFFEDYDYRLPILGFPVDAGVDGFADDLNFDFDGNDRVNGAAVDLGAFENPYCINNSVEILAADGLEACEGETIELSASVLGEYFWSNDASDSTITVEETGDFYLTVIDELGCLGEAEASVTIYETSIEITGQDAYCEGSFTTVTAEGDNTDYVWSDGQEGASAIFSSEGEFTVTAESTEGGCPVEASITITESPIPDPAIFNTDNLLSTGFFTTYQWFLDGEPIAGATDNTYQAAVNGVYHVEVTNAAGCEGISSTSTVDDIIIHVGEEEILFNVYPTIFDESFTVRNTSGVALNIALYDMNGRLVLADVFTGNDNLVNTIKIECGVYLLVLMGDGSTSKFRLVKK